jgi:acetyltransferase-like isoleucine patch superfamily enzyme
MRSMGGPSSAVLLALLRNPLFEWLRWTATASLLMVRHRADHLRIGRRTRIVAARFGRFNAVHDGVTLVECELGDFTYVAEGSTLYRAAIGKFCSIGAQVSIGGGLHPSRQFVSAHPAFYSPAPRAGASFADRDYFRERAAIRIGNDVWIGNRAILFDGVTVGDGAFIGANAVVTRDVAPYAVVAGVPARLIRYRFAPDEIAFLEAFRWYDKDIAWLAANFRALHDIEALRRLAGAADQETLASRDGTAT